MLSTTWRYRGLSYHEQVILGAEYGCRSNGTVTTDHELDVVRGPSQALDWRALRTGRPTGFIQKVRCLFLLVRQSSTRHLWTSVPISSEPLRMEVVARTDASGARVFGGSTFAYSCFLIASCPTNWFVGDPQQPLVVSDSDAVVVGRMVSRVLSWASNGGINTGDVGTLRISPPAADSISPRGGLHPQKLEQEPAVMR